MMLIILRTLGSFMQNGINYTHILSINLRDSFILISSISIQYSKVFIGI